MSRPAPDRGKLHALWPMWSRFWARPGLVVLGLCSVPLSGLMLLAMPWLAGRLLDLARAGDEASRAELWWLAAAFGLAALLEAALRFVGRKLLIDRSRVAEEELKRELQRRMVRLPLDWHQRHGSGDLISTATQDVELLRFVTGPALLYGGQALVVVPGGLLLIAGSSPLLALSALLIFAVLALGLRRLAPRVRRDAQASQDAVAALSQHAAEAFAGLRVLQAFYRAEADQRAMHRLGECQRDAAVGLARARAMIDLGIHLAIEGLLLAALVIGALEAVAGRVSIGELLTFYATLGIVLPPLLAFGFVFTALPRALAAGERVGRILDGEVETTAGLTPAPGGGAVEVRGLDFHHPGSEGPALHGIDFALPAGAKLGIVGPVGSGKSTLCDLLLRFIEPPPGTIFVDGRDLLELDPRALRAHFALAAQEPFLFGASIADNIRFGGGTREPGELAMAAGLGPDLSQLEDGLETVVGERGITLSGGQRQRVSLARALAADRPALILDDTLSAVDHGTERRLLGLLARERRGRTAIVATHRLSVVRDADLILVLDGGRIVDRGRHDELIHRPGYYAETWQRQVERRALESGPEVDEA